jgi:hypothetical protein
MADGSGTRPESTRPDPSRLDAPSGRIKPQDADQVLVACMIVVASARFHEAERELALHLMARALRMVSAATRMQALIPAAQEILAAAPHRRKRGDAALIWASAHLDLCAAVTRDALAQALARVER